MPLKSLIAGAGIAGLSLAYNLSNAIPNTNPNSPSNPNSEISVTLIERHPVLRATGLQIDLRGHGIQVLKRMGLEKAYREKIVHERGLAFVDSSGKQRAFFPAGQSKNGRKLKDGVREDGKEDGEGEGVQGFSTDWEIMRGDLCRLLYAGINRRNTECRFGIWITELQELDGQDGVRVTFSNGSQGVFDLVVGADGIGSGVRRLMFDQLQLQAGLFGSGSELALWSSDPFVHSLGVYIGYFTVDSPIPPSSTTTTTTTKDTNLIDPYIARIHLSTKRRILFTRRHNAQSYQIYIILAPTHPLITTAKCGGVSAEKRAMAEILRGAGWKTNEVIDLMNDADDFYCDHLGVVRLNSWSRGAVVLVGDAAYAPSATTGMGSSSAVVGAYVLTGEILKNLSLSNNPVPLTPSEKKGNVLTALKSYEDIFRPFMDDVQEGIERGSTYWDKIPCSRIGVAIVYFVLGIVSFLRLDVLANYFIRERVTAAWGLPEYGCLKHGLSWG
ncbi:hypothetical protein BDW69DRAFT_183485 [Aspergillus filifer]